MEELRQQRWWVAFALCVNVSTVLFVMYLTDFMTAIALTLFSLLIIAMTSCIRTCVDRLNENELRELEERNVIV